MSDSDLFPIAFTTSLCYEHSLGKFHFVQNGTKNYKHHAKPYLHFSRLLGSRKDPEIHPELSSKLIISYLPSCMHMVMLVTQLSIKSLSFSSTGILYFFAKIVGNDSINFILGISSALRLYSVVLKSAKSPLKISEIIFSPEYCYYQQSL